MTGEPLCTAGLSGDLGWNEAEQVPIWGFGTALLVLASGAVWSSVWLLSGLPPLLWVASRVRSGRHIVAEHVTACDGTWRSKQA